MSATDRLIEAALDDAYKEGIVDAEGAAMNAIYDRFRTRPSDERLCADLMHLVGLAIIEAANNARSARRMEMVSDRAMSTPRKHGMPVIQ